MIRYQYVTAFSPPAPFVNVSLRKPQGASASAETPAQVDCAADRTVVPSGLIEGLGLAGVRQIVVEGLGGDLHTLDTFVVTMRIHDLQPITLEVVAHADEAFILLGRDVLNRLRIVLDGPQQVLEIG